MWGSTAPVTRPRRGPASGAPTPEYRPPGGAPSAAAIVVVSVVVLAAFLVGLAVWQISDGGGSEAATETTASTAPPDGPNGGVSPQAPAPAQPLPTVPPTTTPPVPEPDVDLLAQIEEIKAFVARNRDLDFLADVPVEVVDAGTYDARLRESMEARREAIEDTGKVWSALGLIEPTVPFFDALWTTQVTATSVRYDPATEALVVEDGALDGYRRAELAEQLTVALVDQHHGALRPELDAVPDESALAFASLLAGDAGRMSDLWLQAVPEDEQLEAVEREQEVAGEVAAFGIPEKVLIYVNSPERLGALLVDELAFSVRDALDAAYASPPTTTEQLIEPSAYEDGEEAIAVDPPPADGEVFDEGVLGEYLLIVALTDVLGPDRAFDVGEGWGGDWFVAWSTPDGAPCIRADLVGDDDLETDEIEAGLIEWSTRSGAEVERTEQGLVRFTMCAASGGGSSSRL